MRVPVGEIKVSPGRREVTDDAVSELVKSMGRVGLLNPITLDKNYTLIAGLHRLKAAQFLGWEDIECTVTALEGIHAELAEIDENIVRKNLPPVEENDLLLRRKELYEMIHPETKNGQRNGQTSKNDKMSFLETRSFVEDAADKLGVNRRTIERQVQAAKNMTPDAKAVVRASPKNVPQKKLLEISRLPKEAQTDAAKKTVAELNAPKEPKTLTPQDMDNAYAEAVASLKDPKDFMVQCKVYIGLTYEQEAELFYKLDAAKTRLSSAQSTKARLESGVDPRVSEVHAIMTANGYTWSMDHGCGKPWHIAVTDAIVGAYDLLGAKEFDRLLRVIGAAWKGAPAALRANFLSGMALFLKTYGSDVSDDALAKRLGKVDPLEVLRCGKADTSTSQNALRYARVLWEKYNGRLGRNRLPYRFGCEG